VAVTIVTVGADSSVVDTDNPVAEDAENTMVARPAENATAIRVLTIGFIVFGFLLFVCCLLFCRHRSGNEA
jgi:hypothetical protein